MTTKPTIKPRLKKIRPGVYVGRYDPWPGGGTPVQDIRVEDDGSEWVWVRTDGWGKETTEWYPTLAAFREYLAEINVARWLNSGRRRKRVDPEHHAAAEAFLKWARRKFPKCHGVRTMSLPGFGVSEVHDGCCNNTLARVLPDGVTLVTLYEEWSKR